MPVNEKDLVFVDVPKAPKVQPEGWGAYAGRQALGGLEKVAEAPFALNELLRNVGQKVPGAAPIFQGVQSAQQALGIPTAQEFRGGAEKALGYKPGSFTPEGIGENILQEGISTAAQTALTGGLGSVPKHLKSIAGSAIGGNVLEGIGDLIDLPESFKAPLHFVGNILGGSYGGRSAATKAYNKNYKAAEAAIPEKATFQTKQGQKVAEGLLDKVSDYPGYDKIKPDIEKFKNLFANEGRVDVDKAWKFKKRLNELTPTYPRDIRREFINPMRDVLNNDVLREYGKTNPKFLNPFLHAEQDYKALQGGLVTMDHLRERAPNLFKKLENSSSKVPWALKGAKYALAGVIPGGLYYAPLATTGVGAAGLSAGQANRFAKLIKNSPTAQKYAGDAIKNLAAGHINNSVKLFNQMGKELEKHDIDKDLVFI